LFDDATARPVRAPVHTGSNLITRGPTATRIYGFNNESTEWGFRSLTVLADGLHEETVKSNLLQGWVTDIVYDGGFVYATSGDVIEVPTMLKVGTIPVHGVVRPDAANRRVHFLREDGTISTYHNTVFNPLGSFQAQALGGRTRLIRWGTDGLAAGGGEIVVLLRGKLVAP